MDRQTNRTNFHTLTVDLGDYNFFFIYTPRVISVNLSALYGCNICLSIKTHTLALGKIVVLLYPISNMIRKICLRLIIYHKKPLMMNCRKLNFWFSLLYWFLFVSKCHVVHVLFRHFNGGSIQVRKKSWNKHTPLMVFNIRLWLIYSRNWSGW